MSQNHGRRRVAKGCNHEARKLGYLGKTQGERDEYSLRRANSFLCFDVSDQEHVIMTKTPIFSAGLSAPGPQQVAKLEVGDGESQRGK
eukprot:101272-Pleurochrysis_carterae.AAC.1